MDKELFEKRVEAYDSMLTTLMENYAICSEEDEAKYARMVAEIGELQVKTAGILVDIGNQDLKDKELELHDNQVILEVEHREHELEQKMREFEKEIELKKQEVQNQTREIEVSEQAEANKIPVVQEQNKGQVIQVAVSGGLMIAGVAIVAIFEKMDGGGIIQSKLLSPLMNILRKK